MIGKKETGVTVNKVLIFILAIILAEGNPIMISSGNTAFAVTLPTIIRSSLKAGPGDAIGVYGDSFGTSATVKMKALTGFTRVLTPEAADIEVSINNVQDNLIEGIIPLRTKKDMYAVWVNNGTGWSATAYVNQAEVFSISENVVYPGQTVRAFGRNFTNPVTGTASGAGLKLVRADDGSAIAANISIVTENTIDFDIPADVVPGKMYTISVTNGAGENYGWVQMKNDEAFKVASGNGNINNIRSLFGISEAWTASIPSTSVYNVKNYGVKGDGVTDDTSVVQSVLNGIGTTGGMVHFPAGTYCLGKISLPNNVILYGDGKSSSILKLIDDGAGTGMKFIDTSSAAGGIANLSLISEVLRPATDTTRRTGGYVTGLRLYGGTAGTNGGFFVKNIVVDIADGSGIYSDSTSTSLIVENSDFKVSHSNIMDYYARTRILNNTFYNTERPVLFLGGSNGYNWVEGNHIDALHVGVGRESGTNDTEHRIMDLGCLNNYIANNIVTGEYGATTPNADNSGEGILFQSSRRTGYGRVISSTADTITVEEGSIKPDNPETKDIGMKTGDFVAIVDGRGIGQLRKITGFTTSSITVDKPWDVLPDNTSVFTADYRVIYHNILVGNNIDAKTKKGGICLYTKNYDNIITDNTMSNTGGIWLGQSQVLDQYRADFSYFIYVYQNKVTGASDSRGEVNGVPVGHGKGNCVVIGPCVDGGPVTTLDTNLPSVGIYGNEYRSNQLTGIGTNVIPINDFNSKFVYGSGIMISTAASINHAVSQGVIVERNKITNTAAGIHISNAAYDTFLLANDFSGNKVEIDNNNNTNSVRTILGLNEAEGLFVTEYGFYKDINGTVQEIKSLQAGMITGSVSVKNNEASTKDAAFIMALYEDEKLMDLEIVPQRIGAGENEPFSAQCNITDNVQHCKIKMFVWEDLNGIVSVSESYTLLPLMQ